MAEAVYLLCVLTSALIAVLLLRGYRRTGERLLLWTGIGFVCYCVNNILVTIDLTVGETIDLSIARNLFTLAGGACIVFGLIWDRE
jgi:hypothetical protein